MELLQLRYFADAARSENFSQTAKRNLVPQSTISQTIKKLETELGVRLFERTGNKVYLNECGKTFYKGVDTALKALDSAISAVSDSKNEIKGDICILIQTNRRLVTESIADFKNLYPHVNFSLNHEYFCVNYDKFDLWISDQVWEQNNIEKELLITEKLLIAVSNQHPLAHKKSVSVSELVNERFITMPTNSSLHKTLVSICRNHGFEPQIAIQCDDPYYVRKYVETNLGIALFPEFSWKDMFGEKVTFLYIKDLNISRNTYVYWKNTKYLSNAVRAFKDKLIEKFKE